MAIAMETLLAELSTELGELVPGVRINNNGLSGQVTTAAVGTSIVDVNNRFELDPDAMSFNYLRVVSDSTTTTNQNVVVQVATYNTATNTITVTPGLASTSTNTQYQIFRRLPPSAYLQAITESIRSAFPAIHASKSNTSLSIVAQTYIYTVPADFDEVTLVEIQTNLGITDYPYKQIPFDLIKSDELQTIQLLETYPATYKLRITGMGAMTAPTSLISTINISGDDIEIVKIGAKSSLYRRLAGIASDGSEDQSNFLGLAKTYYDLFQEAKHTHRKLTPKMQIIRDPRYGWL